MSNFKLPDELLGGAVKVIRPTDLRNRIGMYMLEERGIKIGRKVDPGDVQDMIVEFTQRELERAQGTPEPPKVEEIAAKLLTENPVTGQWVRASSKEYFTEALRSYFPPASQTPQPCNFPYVGTCSCKPPNPNHTFIVGEPLAAPASTTDGWVSVEDRLPKVNKHVEILISDAAVAVHDIPCIGWLVSDGTWWCGIPGHYFHCPQLRWTVTDWRELPAAPGSVPQAEPPK
jgi:Protein of unknown function (DUF551)